MAHPTAMPSMTATADEYVTVRIEDFYLCFWKDDEALADILRDPRAEVAAASAANILWHAGDVDVDGLWTDSEVDT